MQRSVRNEKQSDAGGIWRDCILLIIDAKAAGCEIITFRIEVFINSRFVICKINVGVLMHIVLGLFYDLIDQKFPVIAAPGEEAGQRDSGACLQIPGIGQADGASMRAAGVFILIPVGA